jgi:hypothetical protein
MISFVLSANSGMDTVLNFSVGTDKFVLAGGLSFEARCKLTLRRMPHCYKLRRLGRFWLRFLALIILLLLWIFSVLLGKSRLIFCPVK